MPISPQDMLNFAVSLVSQVERAPASTADVDKETLCRSASSRAYYAAFNMAIEWAKRHGYVPKKNSEHSCLQDWFSCHSEESLKTVGSRLQAMHSTRVDADYKLNKTMDRRGAQSVCKTANYVITELQSRAS